jgi:hypothetical protein
MSPSLWVAELTWGDGVGVAITGDVSTAIVAVGSTDGVLLIWGWELQPLLNPPKQMNNKLN